LRSAAKTVDTIEELHSSGLVRTADLAALDAVAARYAVAITPAIAQLIDPADPHDPIDDPIARQFVPDPRELKAELQEMSDPIGDDAHSPVEGIVHRYSDRVLLKLVHICPVYCRFCFRRAMVGPRGRPSLTREKLDAALAYIRAHPDIWEVILTGGDPLILSARKLREVLATYSDVEDMIRIGAYAKGTSPQVDRAVELRPGDGRSAAASCIACAAPRNAGGPGPRTEAAAEGKLKRGGQQGEYNFEPPSP